MRREQEQTLKLQRKRSLILHRADTLIGIFISISYEIDWTWRLEDVKGKDCLLKTETLPAARH